MKMLRVVAKSEGRKFPMARQNFKPAIRPFVPPIPYMNREIVGFGSRKVSGLPRSQVKLSGWITQPIATIYHRYPPAAPISRPASSKAVLRCCIGSRFGGTGTSQALLAYTEIPGS
jgi:hypothetical protein